jgi:hypothetical protein
MVSKLIGIVRENIKNFVMFLEAVALLGLTVHRKPSQRI